jgi:hypothetical protein
VIRFWALWSHLYVGAVCASFLWPVIFNSTYQQTREAGALLISTPWDRLNAVLLGAAGLTVLWHTVARIKKERE